MAKKHMVYSKIKELQEAGFSQRNIANQLGISRSTVKRYLTKDPEEFSTWLASTEHRKQKLDIHKERILNWLRQYPDISTSQIHDWLEERKIFDIAESTLRRYVKGLRDEYQIPKVAGIPRQYEAIPDPPLGEQAQIDFGQSWVTTAIGSKIKLYVVAFVLSHSRYKYMEWWDHPYTTEMVIQAHENAFNFFEGKPKTIVYDQDRVLFVDENYGDILFTKAFEAYRQTQKFHVHACRGADPESKGRIENVIGFIKNNFAKHRIFTDLDHWNEQGQAWLRRKGNGKVHHTTKKIPAEVFQIEQKYLLPSISYSKSAASVSDDRITLRYVRKDNTVNYKTNRYSVPLGTYFQLTQVAVTVNDEDKLRILDPTTKEVLAEHDYCRQKGKLIQNRSHCRDRNKSINQIKEQLAKQFNHPDKAAEYFDAIHGKYPRYARDQLDLIEALFEKYPSKILDFTIEQCLEKNIISATGFRDFAKQSHRRIQINEAVKQIEEYALPPLSESVAQRLAGVQPEVRELTLYTDLLGGKSYHEQ